jgi:hypothetical protein
LKCRCCPISVHSSRFNRGLEGLNIQDYGF